MNQLERTEMLLGEEGMRRLQAAQVAVFGVGGVGGYAAEALARSGIGALALFDSDQVTLTNLNRQIIALHSTLGKDKVLALKERLLDIRPELPVTCCRLFYLPENAGGVDLRAFRYVVDAMDTVTAKLELICRCREAGVPVISAMGAGNRLDPTRLRVTDIAETSGCPLARVVRRELRRRGVESLTVAFSDEEPRRPLKPAADAQKDRRRDTPGSAVFVPAAMGLAIASHIVRSIAGA